MLSILTQDLSFGTVNVALPSMMTTLQCWPTVIAIWPLL